MMVQRTAYEAHGVSVEAQPVRIDRATRQNQRVELVSGHVRDHRVDRERAPLSMSPFIAWIFPPCGRASVVSVESSEYPSGGDPTHQSKTRVEERKPRDGSKADMCRGRFGAFIRRAQTLRSTETTVPNTTASSPSMIS